MRKYKFPIVSLVYPLSLLLVVCFCNTGPIHAASGAGDLKQSEPRLSGSGHSESTLNGPTVPDGESGAKVTKQSAGFDSSVRFTVPGRASALRIGEADSGYGCRFTLQVLPFPLHAAGGTGSLNVHVTAIFNDGSPDLVDPGALCPWGINSNTPWISGPGVNDPSIDSWTTDSKIVDFYYSRNGSTPRLGKIYVSGVDVDVIQAGAIGCGEVITGTFGSFLSLYPTLGQLYPFEFPANEGDVIALSILWPNGYISHLVNGVDLTLPSTGAFSFSSALQTGSYRLSLQFIKGGNCSPSIACGQTVSSQIAEPLKMNAYRFSANAGEMVKVKIDKTGSTSGSFSPYFRLYTVGGRELVNYAGDPFLPLPETGTYTIIVADSDWYSDGLATGTYDVGLQFITGRCANTIACGQAFIGIPNKKHQMDVYKFSGSEGERVGLFLYSAMGTGSANGALFDPDGQFVTGDVPGIEGTEFGGGAQTWTLPKTGNYTYLVDPTYFTDQSTYDLYRPCRGLCTVQLLGSSACLPADGGIGTIWVLIGPGCPWTSSSNASWADIVSGGSKDKLWALTYQAGPNAYTRRTGTLTIAGKTFNICQLGAGEVTPIIHVTPTSLTFGDVHLRSTKDLILTVKNTGGGTLTGNATTETPFSIVSGGSYSLGPEQSQVVTIRYQPTSPGMHTGTVVFTGGDGATVSVTGKAEKPRGLPWLLLLLGN